MLGISRTAVYGLITSGELSSVTIGRRRRVPLAACHEFVARRLAAMGAVAGAAGIDSDSAAPAHEAVAGHEHTPGGGRERTAARGR